MQQPAPRTKQIVAAVIGNALEWYDFVVYGFLTVIISRLFFPSESEYTSLLLTMATFGVGFFMRPVGGIVIGLYADRKGRKAALQLIILCRYWGRGAAVDCFGATIAGIRHRGRICQRDVILSRKRAGQPARILRIIANGWAEHCGPGWRGLGHVDHAGFVARTD
jgi:MFS family permease